MSHLAKPEPRDRSKIKIESAAQCKCWARQLGVTPEQLRQVVDKVGESAATVRKEIDALRKQDDTNTAE